MFSHSANLRFFTQSLYSQPLAFVAKPCLSLTSCRNEKLRKRKTYCAKHYISTERPCLSSPVQYRNYRGGYNGDEKPFCGRRRALCFTCKALCFTCKGYCFARKGYCFARRRLCFARKGVCFNRRRLCGGRKALCFARKGLCFIRKGLCDANKGLFFRQEMRRFTHPGNPFTPFALCISQNILHRHC